MMRFVAYWCSLLITLSLLIAGQASAAEAQIQLFLNGKALVSEVPPRIIKDNTMVPIRVIAESVGANVTWDGKQRKVGVSKEDTQIQLTIDKADAVVNGSVLRLESAPVIVEGNTLLPLRFVSEQLGVKVTWDELTRSVFLFQSEGTDVAQTDTDKPQASAGSQDKPSGKPVEKPADVPAFIPSSPDKVPAGETAKPSVTAPTKPDVAVPGKKDEPVIIKAVAVTGDKLSINTAGGTVKPNVTMKAETNQLIIDMPGTVLDKETMKTAANGEGKIDVKADSVSQVRYLLFAKESSIVRIVVDLSKKVDWKPIDKPAAGEYAWKLIPVKTKALVVIDAGHGGKDTGAISQATKRREKDFVLPVSIKVAELLAKEPQIEVKLTRSDDTFLELAERVAIANEQKADVFVSVHANSTTKETIRGTETYYYTEQSLDFAEIMHKHVLEATGFPDRKVKQGNFHVIRNTEMPSVLLEIGFLSNRTEESTMFQEDFQQTVAAAIVAGIKEQLHLK
jgi:N-acetylmuramoyl-L-alanine amidase